jgi:lipoprotein-anchoring transpeptidase ErfK/SrfK
MLTDNSSHNVRSELQSAMLEGNGKMQEQALDLMVPARAAGTPAAADSASDYKLAGGLPGLTLSDHMPVGTADSSNANRSVVVVEKGPHHRTHVFQKIDGQIEEVLNIPNATGTGKLHQVTPEGRFSIKSKEPKPTWCPTETMGGGPCVGPGPHNPLGPYKMRTTAFGGNIMLHGTNRPDQIGTDASHGCIRHYNKDILRMKDLVGIGDAVYITKNINGLKVRSEDFRPR